MIQCRLAWGLVYSAVGLSTTTIAFAAQQVVCSATVADNRLISAVAINNHGSMIGVTRGSENEPHSIMLRDGRPIELGTIDGIEGIATDLNDNETIVGIIATDVRKKRGFIYRSGEMVPVDGIEAVALNNVDTIVGTMYSKDGETHAAVWSRGILTDIGSLDGGWSVAQGVNDAGHVVGYSTLADAVAGKLTKNCGYRDLVFGATAENIRQVNAFHAFHYDGTLMVDLGTLGGCSSWALDINERGQIVGHSDHADGSRHAFLFENGKMIDLGPGMATKINEKGDIIGYYEQKPALWLNRSPEFLSDVLEASGQVSKGMYAQDINDRGQIILVSTDILKPSLLCESSKK